MVSKTELLKDWLKMVVESISEILTGSGNIAIFPGRTTSQILPRGTPFIPWSEIEICSEIPRYGASADIHKARMRAGGRKVAVKKFRIWQSRKEEMIKLFLREVNIMTELKPHPNIIRVIGVTQCGEIPSVIMPWMEDGSLLNVLQLNPSNTARETWSKEITDGMLFLKRSAVVHGDLKSANILIDQTGNAQISDFGLSRHASPTRSSVPYASSRVDNFFAAIGRSTSIGNVSCSSHIGAGSSRWMAPENLYPEMWGRLSTKSTFESDVFALAMVFYEIFTSKLPFYDQNERMAVLSIVQDKRPSRPISMPDGIWNLTTCCWHRSPLLRPAIEAVHEEIIRCFQSSQEAFSAQEQRLITQE